MSKEERDLLRSLPDRLHLALEEDDPRLRRLFPPAYVDDPEREAEYQRLMREELIEKHRAALETLTSTIDATELDSEQLAAWLAALNDFRLVLGTQLDVSEDDLSISTPEHGVYYYLGYLEEAVVEALAGW